MIGLKKLLILLWLLPLHSQAAGWMQKADFGGVARHRTTMLTIGNKIYVGLGHYNGAGINVLFDDWWEYDPATNAWTQKADYAGGICYHASGFTIGAYGYVGTGRISPSGNTLVKDFFRYDPSTNAWAQRTDFPGQAIRGGVGFSVNGYGFIGTGQTTTGATNTFYRYNPTNDTWMQITSIPTGGRISAVAFTIGTNAYVGTGYDSSVGYSTADLYRYSTLSNSWTQMANVAGGIDPTPIPRMEACAFALNGKGYILTGDNYSSGTNYKDMYEFDPVANTWDSLENFQGSARRYMSATTYNGVAYCGLGTNGTNFKDFWVYDLTLSLIEKNLNNISIQTYPNPASNVLNIGLSGIEYDLIKELNIAIYDMMGRTVLKQEINDGHEFMDVSSLLSGQYLFVLQYKDQFLKSQKLSIL